MNFKTILSYLWKLLLSAIAFYVGIMLGGMVSTGIGLPAPDLPAGADQQVLGQYMLIVSIILAVNLAILSHNLSGGFVSRWLTLSFLVWIAHGINNVLEGAIFTSMSAASLFTVVLYAFASFLCGAVVAWLFPPKTRGDDFQSNLVTFFARHSPLSWTWRFLAALLAFPIIYLAFGRLVAPLVTDYYEQGMFDLSLPGWNQIIPVLLLRSLLFLLACLPILISWQKSNRSLFVMLSITLFLLVGGLSMLQAYWFPPALRVVHSLEILADEVLYVGVLVVLLASPNTQHKDLLSSHTVNLGSQERVT